jgi:undecaprenyl diphosphate synthase
VKEKIFATGAAFWTHEVPIDNHVVPNYNDTMQNRFEPFIASGSKEEGLLLQIEKKKLPVHVAIIMDGNGRWAKRRSLDRFEGHLAGAEAARVVAECCARLGIGYLTLFTFSSENWKRPVREVNRLMDMLYRKLTEEREILTKNRIRLRVLGDLERLPRKLRAKLNETEALTEGHENLQINLALSYGARQEIIQAVRRIAMDGIPVQKINEKLFKKYLYTGDIPDPELLIRTSGEYRISNFLLFQSAYSEFYFSPELWPDFGVKSLLSALLDFQNRERRYGGI